MARKKKTYQNKKKGKSAKGKKGKGLFSLRGIGNIAKKLNGVEVAEGNVAGTAAQGLMLTGATLGGGAIGSVLGKYALPVGAVAVVGGLFTGIIPLSAAGGGMMVGGFIKPTAEQQAQVDAEIAKMENPTTYQKQTAKAKAALSNFTSIAKERLMLNAGEKKEETKSVETKTEETKTALAGITASMLNGTRRIKARG